MPHPQLEAISQPQLGAAISHPQVGAAQGSQQEEQAFLAARLARIRSNRLGFLQGSQQGSAWQQLTSQPQEGAAIAQPQLGAAISHPQVGAISHPQEGAAQGSQQEEQAFLAARLARIRSNRLGFLQGSQQGSTAHPQLGAISHPQLGAAISQPQVGAAQASQPAERWPNRPALALAGARVKLAANANKATNRTDISKSPLSDTCQGLVGLRCDGSKRDADNRFFIGRPSC